MKASLEPASPCYLGYNFSSEVAGSLIPQRLQNLCIRDYASARGLKVSFSISEYADASQSLMLFRHLETLRETSGIIFFSLQCLPAAPARRLKFFEQVQAERLDIRFALEELALGEQGAQSIERIFRVSRDQRSADTRGWLLRARGGPE